MGLVRVARVEGKHVLIPTYEERKASDLDLVMAATASAITMVEAGASELNEQEMLDALFAGDEACRQIAALIQELVEKCGTVKTVFEAPPEDVELKEKVFGWFDKVNAVNMTKGKHARTKAIRVADQSAGLRPRPCRSRRLGLAMLAAESHREPHQPESPPCPLPLRLEDQPPAKPRHVAINRRFVQPLANRPTHQQHREPAGNQLAA